MKFKEFLKNNIVLLDGAMGTLLFSRGLKTGEFPERLNVSKSEIITDIHKSYFDAGSNVVITNTFGANSFKFSDKELEDIIKCAVENAKRAKALSVSKKEKFIALDVGPTGKMLKPFGDLDFSSAVEVFKKTISLGVKYGVDLIYIETMNDGYETKAAVLAAKECSNLPILITNVYGANGLTMSGATPESMTATLEGLGVSGLGANCSLGPKELSGVIDRILTVSSTPVIFKPNAGLPKVVGGKTVYDVNEDEFADSIYKAIEKGVRIVGGCCGTTPEYIKKIASKIKNIKPQPIKEKNLTVISSYKNAVDFDKPVIIGERINPTGKKRLKQAILENDISYMVMEAVKQQEAGAHVLDINVGIPEIDECEMLKNTVSEIQSVVDLPLQLDTVSKSALESSLRIYNGKPLINSVNGKKESMETVFPLAKKYGGVIVCLTLDENGIPDTVLGRVNIAKKIVKTAKKYGINKKDLIFDTLTLTVSSDKNAAKTTLDALSMLNKLGYKTVLGVSNVSYGLPKRDIINSSFYTLALNLGLNAAIINPLSEDMMRAYYSYLALNGKDENFKDYISFATGIAEVKTEGKSELSLLECIEKGLKDKAGKITETLLKEKTAIDIINGEIIPALNIVGKNYEEGKVYLPQLLISAEAAKSSFEILKNNAVKLKEDRCKIVLATVKGDIHDIGKNIVKMMLENYGFNVIDLGKDVSPEKIVETVISEHAPICGLSALMTTTVENMKETVNLLKKKAPWCKTVVGGAVLTEEYAKKIGADKYAKDAMQTVRFAESVEEELKK